MLFAAGKEDTDDEEDDDDLSLGTNEGDEEPEAPSSMVKAPPPCLQSAAALAAASFSPIRQHVSFTPHGDWNPIHIKTIYKDGQMKKHQVVFVLLPGGVSNTSTDGMELEIKGGKLVASIPWPTWIEDHSFLKHLRKGMKASNKPLWDMVGATKGDDAVEELEAQFEHNNVCMKQAIMEELNNKKSSGDQMKATTTIPLDIDVKPEIDEGDYTFVGDKDGVRMLFVDLKEAVTEHNNKNKKILKSIDLDE